MLKVDGTMTELNYHGRLIQLKPVQRYDGVWECTYTILEIGPTRSSSVKRQNTGIFLTRGEAEVAALGAAQAEIDSRGPVI